MRWTIAAAVRKRAGVILLRGMTSHDARRHWYPAFSPLPFPSDTVVVTEKAELFQSVIAESDRDVAWKPRPL